jgi:hypothetical protein
MVEATREGSTVAAGWRPVRVAVPDDYQEVARELAPWGMLPEGSEVVAFRDHLAEGEALVQRLAPFEVVVAMRERTPFTRALFERLPALRLLVTTAKRSKTSSDTCAASRCESCRLSLAAPMQGPWRPRAEAAASRDSTTGSRVVPFRPIRCGAMGTGRAKKRGNLGVQSRREGAPSAASRGGGRGTQRAS